MNNSKLMEDFIDIKIEFIEGLMKYLESDRTSSIANDWWNGNKEIYFEGEMYILQIILESMQESKKIWSK